MHVKVWICLWCTVRECLTVGFLCAVSYLSWALCSLSVPDRSKQSGKPLPGLRSKRWDSCIGLPSFSSVQFSSFKSLSCVWLFATPWIAAHQASLSITNPQSSLKIMSIESVMPSSHLILCCPLRLLPQSFPASESFPMSQFFAWGGQSIGVSALASVLPMNTRTDLL